ncbi:DUF1799 domain-containing protein [Castellaniella hirudinis]|uniref:DUF1799 domain-containing protein n=1 Tax=Castellaniella hirudinis TaxID=1144617 RepID=UPI0039C3C2C5
MRRHLAGFSQQPNGGPAGKLRAAAEALFRRPPDESALAAFGFTADDFKGEDVEVWPENWPALDLCARNRTQVIAGPGGLIGLNYIWFQSCLDRQGLDAEEVERIMSGIRVIEAVLLVEAYRDE